MNQAIQKRIGLVGLKEEYIKDIKVHVWLRKLMVLMLIPPEEVKETFEYIKNESLNGIDAVDKKYQETMKELYSYFESTWLKKFPIDWWNSFSKEVRTNNNAEGYHAGLKKTYGISHANYFVLINILRQIENYTYEKYNLNLIKTIKKSGNKNSKNSTKTPRRTTAKSSNQPAARPCNASYYSSCSYIPH